MVPFYKKLNAIMEIANNQLKNELLQAHNFWNPTNQHEKLSDFINSHVKKDSENKNSVAIYSILLEKSEEDIIDMFDSDDLK